MPTANDLVPSESIYILGFIPVWCRFTTNKLTSVDKHDVRRVP